MSREELLAIVEARLGPLGRSRAERLGIGKLRRVVAGLGLVSIPAGVRPLPYLEALARARSN